MDIINLSLGTAYPSVILEHTINYASKKGISIVAAGGNNGNIDGTGVTVEYPARYEASIAVAATDRFNNRGDFSATGSAIEIAAPGVNIVSTYLNNGYASFSGTSMATAYVTGNLALIKGMFPTLSNLGLREKLLSGVLDIGIPGKDTYFGYGLIQAPKRGERIAGKDRFEVAANVSKKAWQTSNTVFITNYIAFADALSAAPLAYKYNAPILLTNSNHLNQTTKEEILRLGTRDVVVVGGRSSISNAVVNELEQMGISTRRIDGANRFEVSANIAAEMGEYSTTVITNGLSFSDALAIAPFASRKGIPILLTRPNEVPLEIELLINQSNINSTLVVGGEGSVSPLVLSKLPKSTRIGGKDRYEVAANIYKKYYSEASSVYLASGETFADALTGSVLIGKNNTSILLVKKNEMPAVNLPILSEKEIYILGGTGSVSDGVISEY